MRPEPIVGVLPAGPLPPHRLQVCRHLHELVELAPAGAMHVFHPGIPLRREILSTEFNEQNGLPVWIVRRSEQHIGIQKSFTARKRSYPVFGCAICAAL